MKNTIHCPSCQTEIELTEVVAAQAREEMKGEIERRRRELEESYAKRDQELRTRAGELERQSKAVEEKVREQLRLEKTRLVAETRKQLEQDIAVEMKDLREQLETKGQKLAQAQQAQVEFLKKQRELEERGRELELELEKRLMTEREKLQQKAREVALEENQLKLADKEKTIAELRKQIELLNVKASKGSQQLQGEVLEQRFEAMLRQAFPHDEITPIRTGAHGADLLQKVRTAGMECGAILWEIKRTASFQKNWIPKLKEDQREEAADLAVILTQSLPDDCEHFEQRDGVWITAYHCGLSLAQALRQGLIQLGTARRASTGQKEKMAVAYQYLCGLEFRQTIEAMVGNYLVLKNDLDKERAAMERIWANRAKQLDAMIRNTAEIYGGLQGILGAAALPGIPKLALEAPEDV